MIRTSSRALRAEYGPAEYKDDDAEVSPAQTSTLPRAKFAVNRLEVLELTPKRSSLFAVERVPYRQFAHPVLEGQPDAILLRRSALGHAVGAGRFGEWSRRPVPGLHTRLILGDRGHLSVTSGKVWRQGSRQRCAP